MNNHNIQIKVTGDGSHTLYVPQLNENYHSVHGAYSESLHVFIEHGLKFVAEKFEPVHIFEVGFGTGLNATLSSQFAFSSKIKVQYTGIELHPLESNIIEALNYSEMWKSKELDNHYKLLHQSSWNKEYLLNDYFSLKKIHGSLLEHPITTDYYHVIYFDAFAPEKQPELWTTEILRKMYDALKLNGVLVTYCAKGQFKRDLKSAGFHVETLPGPPGKREMVRATKLNAVSSI